MSLSNDLLFLIRQFCSEEKLKKTAHMLEQETGIFFDMNYLEELVLKGSWNEVEAYLSGFTAVEDNKHSSKMYLEIRKQKFLEALDKHDSAVALDVLSKDLRVFAPSNEEMYKEMTSLLTMDDFRNHHLFSSYGDAMSGRRQLMDEIRPLIEANPHFQTKLDRPQIETSRLRRLINQSLNWQHIQCRNPQPEPQILTLFSDHKCSDEPNEQNQLPSEDMSASSPALSGNSVVHQAESRTCVGALSLRNQTSQAMELEGVGDSSKISSRMLLNKKVSQRKHSLLVDFPNTVQCCMEMSSSPTSMDFHPDKAALLLVGNSIGDVEVWDIGSEVKLFGNAFMIWKRQAISKLFLNDLDKDPHMSVNRVLWSPECSIFGVAYSRNIVQLYSYNVNTNYAGKQLEVEAHVGAVNDLAFALPYDRLLIVTCGDDKFIQVWDTETGSKEYTFEGHRAPVYSICPHVREDTHFLFSTSTNGEIKLWLLESMEQIATYDAPGHSCMRMAYSSDGKRLFLCGTNKDKESYMAEWNETEGSITRFYHGLSNSSAGIVQFSTSRNRLVAGDEHLIKVWDINEVQILTVVDADGGLPATPYVCFNKKGTLLAVFSDKSEIKILANEASRKLLKRSNFQSFDPAECLSVSLQKLGIEPTPTSAGLGIQEKVIPMEANMTPEVPLELHKVLNSKRCPKILQVSSCKFLRLPSEVKTNKICRLVYTNSGNGILALAADGIHLVWKWKEDEFNDCQHQETTKPGPYFVKPRNGSLMINDLSDNNFELISPCFSLSKNDSYLLSASGKIVSLFNATSSKTISSFLPAPPAATCIAFYPQDNNIAAFGMDDSTILIYNVRKNKSIKKLKGHMKRITGLAFSNELKVLVSSGVDTQIFVWDCGTWEKKQSTSLQISPGWTPSENSETTIQFHQDQRHFLAVHETQLAIYEATNLKSVNQWMIGDFCARISCATLSCDDKLVYVLMRDGIVMILKASVLSPRLELDPSVYLPPTLSSRVYPTVIAAHPKKPNQFALGLSDGGVVIIDPPEHKRIWIPVASVDNERASS